jgi:cytochrome c553
MSLLVRLRVACAAICFLAAGPLYAADVTHGESLYRNFCATCHNEGGNPGPGPVQLGAGNADAIAAALADVVEMNVFESLFKRADLEDIAAYLGVKFGVAPPVAAPATSDAIEYHHAVFDHYFITAIADEIAKLDDGTFAGWARTGRQFKVYTASGATLSAVCRFFSTSFAPKSSHFYTASASECTTVKASPDWQFEAEVFFVAIPAVDGTCAAGTIPVYRLYNNGQGAAPNHRFTTDLAVRADMMTNGWIAEGFGIGVTMCVPP